MSPFPHASSLRRLALAGLAISAGPLFAADFTSNWIGESGNWSSPPDWNTPGAPGTFPNNGAFTYDASLANDGMITLDQNISIEQFTLSSGTVTGGFDLTVMGDLIWTGGTMSGTGSTSVGGAGSIISGNSAHFLGRVLANSGTITFEGPATSILFGSDPAAAGVLINGGMLHSTAGSRFFEYFENAGHPINNAGIWNVSGAGTTSEVSKGITFSNSGTVNVLSGTLALGGGGTSTGSFAISAGAKLSFTDGVHHLNAGGVVSGAGDVEFSGGTVNIAGSYVNAVLLTGGEVNFNAPAALSSVTINSGTLSGSEMVSVIGNLTWTGGVMGGTGATSVAGVESTISGGVSKALARTLTNSGTVTCSSSAAISFGFGSTPGVLNNNGTFNVSRGAFSGSSASGNEVNNLGTWNVSGAGASVHGIAFNNTGIVNVLNGVLAVGNGGGDEHRRFCHLGGCGSKLFRWHARVGRWRDLYGRRSGHYFRWHDHGGERHLGRDYRGDSQHDLGFFQTRWHRHFQHR